VSADRYEDFVFSPAELAEDVELPPELKKEILFLHARLGGFDHWQVLGVAWNAPVAAVRAAYVEKVKLFHPDRHAGRRLGSYLPRIEKIFRALTTARDVLCDEARRGEYAKKTAPPEQFARIETRRLDDELRAQERRARLARGNPMMAKVSRVQEFLQRGRTAMAEGKFSQAANDFLVVVGLDPRNTEARELAEQARRRAGTERARSLYDEALANEASGNRAGALLALRQATDLDPGNPRYATAASRLALLAGSLDVARELAEKAVRAGPRDARALEALGAALHASGEKQEARRTLEQALALDPDLTTARKLARKLRWSFR
jgi:tetratricopeptide (TPR) repeat protein